MQTQVSKPRKKHPAIVYLRKYTALKLRRDDLKDELAMIRQMATRATSRITAERISGTPNKDGMANAAIKAVAVEKKLETTINNIKEALDVRLWLIEQLKDEWEKTILTERYINGRGWEDILARIPFERSSMFEIHGEALEHFWEIYCRNNQSAD